MPKNYKTIRIIVDQKKLLKNHKTIIYRELFKKNRENSWSKVRLKYKDELIVKTNF